MGQYVPEVTAEDVERILSRDFPAESREELRQRIDQVEVRGKDRVILACMKIAGGDVEKLKRNLDDAPGYYREILGEAEYPNYMKKLFRIEKLPESEVAKIIEKDKSQYLAWFNRPGG